MHSIGARVQQRIGEVCPTARHRDLAADIGMTPDAFSRAVNDKRAFSSIELARLADRLNADLHWLITGEPDPHRLVVAARHNFDHTTGHRAVPGRDDDDRILQDIALAYRQAYPNPIEAPSLPRRAREIRSLLGEGFVRPFAERLEARLSIQVVRVPDLSTDYSFAVGGRRIIAVQATGNWFRENWSIAHECGHLVLDHHDDGLTEAEWSGYESVANRFAADLLLPRKVLTDIDWDHIDARGLAELIWQWGVSTDALARRLNALNGSVPDVVSEWSEQPTQRLLRRHWPAETGEDEITLRMESAAQRRFPLALQEAHLRGIESGELGKGTLAWMLGIEEDALEVDTPSVPEADADELTEALGL